ncbi:MAG: hypothetical protein MAG795_01224 [Candidatus Woesearchaeota archaeon]|nr:hypothetical protein [Candidatus Woesearchaeota archaeon]
MRLPALDILTIAAIVISLIFITAGIGFIFLDDIKSALKKDPYKRPLIRTENIDTCEGYGGRWQEFCEPTQSRISLKLKDQKEHSEMLCCKG